MSKTRKEACNQTSRLVQWLIALRREGEKWQVNGFGHTKNRLLDHSYKSVDIGPNYPKLTEIKVIPKWVP